MERYVEKASEVFFSEGEYGSSVDHTESPDGEQRCVSRDTFGPLAVYSSSSPYVSRMEPPFPSARVASAGSEPTLNGGYPANISNTKTPSAHQSTSHPCPLPSTVSGARYSGVPHRVYVRCRRWWEVFSFPVLEGLSEVDASPSDAWLAVFASSVASSRLASALANPKSVSLTCPSAQSSTFSGFKSRYTICRSCRNSKASKTSQA
mmetsp:Transcript_2601/g.9098  ORF Transcript_2601/g.9098 Transcript_2601/m.9098 type:complete len:206 (+) Transcript_2601:1553-2170(+)